MTHRLRFKRAAGVAAVVAVAAVPAVALAATPLKRSIYVGPINLKVSKTGASLQLSSQGYCHNWTYQIKKISIKNGSFSYSGSTTNNTHANVQGSFTTRRKAKGTVQIGSCSKSSFTAKYSGGY